MSNTYNWSITNMDYTVSQEGYTNVVNEVHWKIEKTDAANNVGDTTGRAILAPPVANNDSFIEWSDLSEAIVIQWVQDTMSEDMINMYYESVDANLYDKANPTFGRGVPW